MLVPGDYNIDDAMTSIVEIQWKECAHRVSKVNLIIQGVVPPVK